MNRGCLLVVIAAVSIVSGISQIGLADQAVNELKALMDTEKAEAEKVIIDGVDEYRVMDAMFESVRVVMSHRGEEYSPAYIQGISGGSFRIAGICPCAPTCNNAVQPQDLIKLLGYEMEYLPLSGDGIDPEEQVKEVLPRVKDEIRAGRPVIVWHAFTNAEWDVVSGFDEEKRQFIGRGSYVGNTGDYAQADEDRTIKCVDICPPQGAIIIGEKTGKFDANKAELAALKEAVRHGRSRKNANKLDSDEWSMMEGILCYDRWIRDFSKPDKERGSGDSYCYGIYRSTHKTASQFLNEMAPKYPDAAQHLKQAAEHFAAEADTLYKGEDLLWWNSPKGPDAERNAKAVELLTKARESYASGIEEIEQALKIMDN